MLYLDLDIDVDSQLEQFCLEKNAGMEDCLQCILGEEPTAHVLFFWGGVACLVPEFQSARLKIIVYFVDLKSPARAQALHSGSSRMLTDSSPALEPRGECPRCFWRALFIAL